MKGGEGGGGGEGYCESETVSREHAFGCQLAEVRSREATGREMRADARETAARKVDARCCIKERTSIVERQGIERGQFHPSPLHGLVLCMRGSSGKDHHGGQGHRRREAKGRSSVDGGGVAPPATVVVVVVVVVVMGVHADGALAHRRRDQARACRKTDCRGGERVASRGEEEEGGQR